MTRRQHKRRMGPETERKKKNAELTAALVNDEKEIKPTPDPLEASWQKDDRRPNPFGLLLEAALKPKLRKIRLDATKDAGRARELERQEEIARAEYERRMAGLQAPGESSSKLAAEPAASARAEQEVPPLPLVGSTSAEQKFEHDADYRNIRFRGQAFALTPKQAIATKALHEAHLHRFLGLSKASLLESLETNDRLEGRLQDIFPKGDPNRVLWGTLIVRVPGRKGMYKLNLAQQPSPRSDSK